MIALIALLLAAPIADASADSADAVRYRQCLTTAGSEPAIAMAEATKWLGAGGGVPARHCLALAYIADKQYGAAMLSLAEAARTAEAQRDPHVGELWGQAGNAALLAAKPDAAVGYFTSGIASAQGTARAQLLIDRARALVDLKRNTEAGADLDQAVKLDPESPFGWLLRATLERRTGNLAVAETSLMEAVRRAPDDADVQLEAGNIAAAQGKLLLARQAWGAAAANAPDSPAGIAAQTALTANPG